jgi:hypothetical protein
VWVGVLRGIGVVSRNGIEVRRIVSVPFFSFFSLVFVVAFFGVFVFAFCFWSE